MRIKCRNCFTFGLILLSACYWNLAEAQQIKPHVTSGSVCDHGCRKQENGHNCSEIPGCREAQTSDNCPAHCELPLYDGQHYCYCPAEALSNNGATDPAVRLSE